MRLIEAVIDSNERDIEDYIRLGADPNFVNEVRCCGIVTNSSLSEIKKQKKTYIVREIYEPC